VLKRACFAMLAVGLSLGAGCPVNNNPASSLVPQPWPEVYGNKENTGFNFVHTPAAVPTAVAWTADVVGDASGVDGDTSKPIVVVVSPVCAYGFRFHPAGDAPGTIDPHFELLWSHALVEVDCDFKTVRSTSPVANAVFSQGASITFTAQEGDPDQSPFLAERVQ
jgi:hypothetical protein